MRLAPLPTFEDFYEAVHGYRPYPWQQRLAEAVCSDGAWPRTIGVPTGAGKTSALDVALYAMAHEADLEAADRRIPRRIVMVVDRRTVVDQSFQHAQVLEAAITSGTSTPLTAMRERLFALMGNKADKPVQVTLMRGGVPRDDSWARRPDQPLLAVSTVDQVGSRLLFRGYGVRSTMMPLHAGLLGHDTLFILDEVHLSFPFLHTLERISQQWRSWREVSLPDRWQVVSLSATSDDPSPFGLIAEDLEHPQLRRRLEAEKLVEARLTDATTHDKKGRPHTKWIRALADSSRDQLKGGFRCVGVVVNRVDTAVRLADELTSGVEAEVLLVTGRMRGADRVEVSRRLMLRADPDWPERVESDDRPFICVSTQAIEVGADLNFDALVTEVASVDALFQRFGRVNRTGAFECSSIIVLAPKDIETNLDPIYGEALSAAWAWLTERPTPFDASARALAGLKVPEEAMAPRYGEAVLLPTHLDLLAQTAPVPHPDPEPGLYLHGRQPPRPEVQIVWRADVSPDAPVAATQRLNAVPPTAFEALTLPFSAARRWLARQSAGIVADVASDDEQDADRNGSGEIALTALLWDGAIARPVQASEIPPGATLVVPCDYGGLRAGNFAGEQAPARVRDVGDIARTIRTGRATLRLDPRVHGQLDENGEKWIWPEGMAPPATPDNEARSLAEVRADLAQWLASTDADGELDTIIRFLRSGFEVEVVDGCFVLKTPRRMRISRDDLLALARGEVSVDQDDARTADEQSSVSAKPVALDTHLLGTERWARDFATACGLPPKIAEDVARAARLHDIGKAHPRFQVFLHGGDEIRAAAGELLAKSSSRLENREARARARQRAALPRGFRHEMASVAMLTSSDAAAQLLLEANDADLVLHLIASHHGHARPLAPPEEHDGVPDVPDFEYAIEGCSLRCPGDHGQDRVNSGVAERYWRLQRRYGWWGLAWLEAILRLADHRESEEEECS